MGQTIRNRFVAVDIEEVRAAPEQGLNYQAGWTVSDGRYTVEATLLDCHAEVFSTAASDGDAMMRSVRFEGPS